ncbi:MAG: dihydroorotase [Treponema sp.]|nr:dihydroorotase [Treponema sp.]
MTKATLIYNSRLLDESMDTPGALLILDGRIRAVFQGYFTSPETASALANSVLSEDGRAQDCKLDLYDARGLTVTPAFIDMHVHMRYPGQTAKEDLDSGLHAAAAGGYGTVVAMPNTNPVVSSAELAMKIEREAAAIGLTHLFQTVSLTKDFEGSDTSHLDSIDRSYIPVITEDGHDVLSSAVMLEAMSKAAKKNIIVSCHCEAPTLAQKARPYRAQALSIMKNCGLSAWGSDDSYDDVDEDALEEIDQNLTSANALLALAEDTATARNIMLAKEASCHIHICHISTANCIDIVREAKNRILDEESELSAEKSQAAYEAFEEEKDFYPSERRKNGFDVTCEVTPHHLALCGSEEPLIRALVNPPLRSDEDRLAIIEALRDGTADVIATDHAPHTIEDKESGAPGFTGLETAFGVCNKVLVKDNQFNPRRLSQLMSGNPARLLGLQKGLLKASYDADITIFDPDEEWTVDSRMFCSKGKATPFDGKKLIGKVHALFIDGRKVFER